MMSPFKYWSDLIERKNRSKFYIDNLDYNYIKKYAKFTYLFYRSDNTYFAYVDEEHKIIWKSSAYVLNRNPTIIGKYIVIKKFMRPGII